MQKNKNSFSRRKFLSTSMLSALGLSFIPTLGWADMTSSLPLTPRDHHKIRLGFIGVGQQAMGILNGMMKIPNVEVLACADVYEIKRERFEQRVNQYNQENNRSTKVDSYADYKDLLAREDIDAVVIASPDHWHALMAIDSCKAGKDIYLEKPLTLTIKEGQELVKAVRRNNIVLAVGSQQRSEANFQHAVRMVQKGKIGKVKQIFVHVGQPASPKPYDLPPQEVPEGLDWNAWIGPIQKIHYNEQLNPPISLNPEKREQFWAAWRWFEETGGGLMTDWGAHMFDIAQWGIGMDRNGPNLVIPATESSPLTFQYANGVEMISAPFDGETRGVKFVGENGWIQVSRGNFSASDETLTAFPKEEKREYSAHYGDFIESIVKRKDPIVPVEIGHSTLVVCTLGNIANELKRPLAWDPKTENFINDNEASAKLHYDYQNGYKLTT